MGRDGADDEHPGQRDAERHQRGERDVPEAPGEHGRRRRQQVGEEERGEHEPRLEHLGLEGQPDPHARDQQEGQAPRRERCRRGVGCEHEQEDQQRVRDVAPVEQDRDRRGRQDGGGGQPGAGAGDAPHGAVEHEHGEGALDGLGENDGPDVEAEHADRQRLHPERAGQLVDRDRAPGVEGAEEEVVPALRHAAYRGAVERLERRAVHAPHVGERGQCRDDEERRPGPAGLVGWRQPELPAAAPGGRRAGGRYAARLGGSRFEREAPDRIPHRRAT